MSCIIYTAQLAKCFHEYFEDSINLDQLDNSTRTVDLKRQNKPGKVASIGTIEYIDNE